MRRWVDVPTGGFEVVELATFAFSFSAFAFGFAGHGVLWFVFVFPRSE